MPQLWPQTRLPGPLLLPQTGQIWPTGRYTTVEPPEPEDPNFSSVSLLLPFDGADGSTVFTDASSNSLTVTGFGDARISTAQSNSGGTSAVFDSNNDYLTVGPANPLQTGTGDFTIEFYLRRVGDTNASTGASSILLDFRAAEPSPQILLYLTGSTDPTTKRIVYYVDGSPQIISASACSDSLWHHIAIVKLGGETKLYFDGFKEGATYADSTDYTADACVIGGRFASISGDFRSLNGYIDDLRITKGIARYTANFTPPTGPFPTS